MDTPETEARIESILATLTIDEKVALAGGVDGWHTTAVPEKGIPPIKFTDGPNGARGATVGGISAACFPCGTALGATWDTELVGEVGAALGREARSKQARVLLAPTVNIHRHPLAGRNFECPSEDPFLTAQIAKAYISGVQSEGVATTVKHFVANDSEFERMTISSEVAERTLREIYLPPFEAAVVEAGSWALMTSYNRINGTYAAAHTELVHDLLKGEWGFDGLVMSDWFGTKGTADSANAGLDLEMPGPPIFFGDRLRAAVAAGEVSEAVIDDKVRRLLRLAIRTGALDDPPEGPETALDDPEQRDLIRRAAAAAIVLLKNDGDLLPLKADEQKLVAVIGPNGDLLSLQGGGSAGVEPHHTSSLMVAIAGLLEGDEVRFEPGCRIHRRPPALGPGLRTVGPDGEVDGVRVDYFANRELEGEPVLTQMARRMQLRWSGNKVTDELEGEFSARATAILTPKDSGLHRFSLMSAGLSRLFIDGKMVLDNWEGYRRGGSFYGRGSEEVNGEFELAAGSSHTLTLEYQSPRQGALSAVTAGWLPPAPVDQMDRAVALAKEADSVILVVGSNSDWETEGSDRVSMSLPGAQDELIRRVVAANSRTVVVVNAGSPIAMPWADEVPAILQAWYPGQEGGDAIADVIFGLSDPGGRLPTTFPMQVEDSPSHLNYPGEAGTVSYGEGIFVGYRGYERRKLAPRFPFGHGLSYTTFAYGAMALDREAIAIDDSVTVSVRVRNTGSRTGHEVVQVYVRDPESSLLRPEKELKGFSKVTLQPGEDRSVQITLTPRAFAAWDPRAHAWVVEPGDFEIIVASSSSNIRGRAMLRVGTAEEARPASFR